MRDRQVLIPLKLLRFSLSEFCISLQKQKIYEGIWVAGYCPVYSICSRNCVTETFGYSRSTLSNKVSALMEILHICVV